MTCGNKQVVIGKKNKQTCKQKIKNNIKNARSAGHESRYCYTSQADRFCDKLPKKKKKANQNNENLPVFPLIQGLPISN